MESAKIKVAFVSGGRESIAMVIKQGVDYYDELVFADTGDDPLAVNTNWFMEKYHGWKIHTVYSKYGKIREYYENKNVDDEPEFTGHAMVCQIFVCFLCCQKSVGNTNNFRFIIFI